MRARTVVGKTIVAVEQQRFWDENCGCPAVSVDVFVLDDGSRCVFGALETSTEPFVYARVFKNGKELK